MGLLFLYGQALLAKWYFVVTGGTPLAIDQLAQLASTRFKHWADQRGPWRRRIEVIFLLGAVTWAGFEAWQDQYQATQGALGQRNAESARRAWWAGVAEDRRQQIEGRDGLHGLQKELADAREEIKRLSKATPPVNQTVARYLPARPPAPPPRDPDTVYQFGDAVAKVQGAQIDLGAGSIRFETLNSHGDFNRGREFEYRDYVLHLLSAQGEVDATVAGQKTVQLMRVVCEILRKRS